jgi:hypothetical protein
MQCLEIYETPLEDVLLVKICHTQSKVRVNNLCNSFLGHSHGGGGSHSHGHEREALVDKPANGIVEHSHSHGAPTRTSICEDVTIDQEGVVIEMADIKAC